MKQYITKEQWNELSDKWKEKWSEVFVGTDDIKIRCLVDGSGEVEETEEIIGTWYGKSVKKTDTGTLLEIIEFQRQSMERMQKQHQRDQDFMEEECEAPTVVIEKDVLEIIKENTTSILAMPLLMAIISGVIVYLILN